jgi:hypothetical protein
MTIEINLSLTRFTKPPHSSRPCLSRDQPPPGSESTVAASGLIRDLRFAMRRINDDTGFAPPSTRPLGREPDACQQLNTGDAARLTGTPVLPHGL